MARHHDRLLIRLFNIIEGRAEGRLAITSLVIIVLMALLWHG